MQRRTFLTLAAAGLQGAAGRVRPGCQTRAFGSPLPQRDQLLAALDAISEAGYEGFETNFASLEHAFDHPAPMRAEFEKRRLQLIGLHASARLHVAAADAEMGRAQRIAQAVADLGGSLLVMSGPGIAPEALPLWTKNLNELGKYCGGRGVRLAVHNHLKELQNDAAELKAVAEATDAAHVSFLLDLSYFAEAGVRPGKLLPGFAPRLAGLHLRDHKGKDEVLLGQGDLDVSAVAAVIDSMKWSGWLILEMNKRQDLSSAELVRQGRTFMKEKLHV